MTCKGYDPKAVKMPKSVKRAAANILNDHDRGEFFRSYVRILESDLKENKKKSKSKE